MLPYYRPAVGAAWLEKGYVYVVANIRGGGEFGPKWHQSASRANRYRAYDDFMAVGEDLVRRKVTSPAHLGIQGGSNGGLLVGNMLVRRPELFGAVVCQVPLLDMRRFNHLLAAQAGLANTATPICRRIGRSSARFRLTISSINQRSIRVPSSLPRPATTGCIPAMRGRWLPR